MNAEVNGETAAGLGAVRIAPPSHNARTRAALPTAVRAKLDQLESDATNALAIARAVGDRVIAVRAEVVAAQQRIQMLQAAGAHRAVNLGDERATLADAEGRLATLAAERTAAEARWHDASRLVAACRDYLGLV